MTERNPYLIKKAMNHFLIATILTMAAGQIGVIIDGIIVSHLVSPDALSAINLYTPLSLLVTSFSTFLGIGATILAARAIGERNRDKAEGHLSTALLSLIVIGVVIGLAACLFREPIVNLICSEERLREPFGRYMMVMLGGCVITMVNTLFNEMVCIDGHPQVATRAVTISSCCNIVLGLLFVGAFKWSIEGSALASLVSALINMCIISTYLFGGKCSFKLRPFKAFSVKSLGGNVQQGTPLIIGNLILTLLFFFLNRIIQAKQGADGMFAMSICMNLLTIGMMVSGSVGSTCLSVGGFLYGQKDFDGLKILVNRGLRFMVIVMAVVTLVIEVWPGLVSGLFGADTPELAAYADSCLRIFAWMLPLVLTVLLLANIYQVLGHLALAPVIIALFPVTLLPSLLIWGAQDGSLVWYAFPETGLVTFSVTLVITEIIRRKSKGEKLSFLTLVPHRVDVPMFTSSIRPDKGEIGTLLDNASSFVASADVPEKTVDLVRHCMEEILLNIIEHGSLPANHFIDTMISTGENAVTVSLKDDGRAFDPTKLGDVKPGAGLKIVLGMCNRMEYKYMYGQNMTFLTWKF